MLHASVAVKRRRVILSEAKDLASIVSGWRLTRDGRSFAALRMTGALTMVPRIVSFSTYDSWNRTGRALRLALAASESRGDCTHRRHAHARHRRQCCNVQHSRPDLLPDTNWGRRSRQRASALDSPLAHGGRSAVHAGNDVPDVSRHPRTLERHQRDRTDESHVECARRWYPTRRKARRLVRDGHLLADARRPAPAGPLLFRRRGSR